MVAVITLQTHSASTSLSIITRAFMTKKKSKDYIDQEEKESGDPSIYETINQQYKKGGLYTYNIS